MLKIIHNLKELDFAQLMTVYEQSNRDSGRENDMFLPENLQILRAEQNFYEYLKLFFADRSSFCAVWAPGGVYKAALRIEAYSDGWLLAGLETAPKARRQGNATALIRAVQTYLREQGMEKLYSHVHKTNTASVAVHMACGFEMIYDYAVYADGSVFRDVATFCCIL